MKEELFTKQLNARSEKVTCETDLCNTQQIASLFSTGQFLYKTSPSHIKNRQKHAMKLAEGITESLVFQDKAIRESADANQLAT